MTGPKGDLERVTATARVVVALTVGRKRCNPNSTRDRHTELTRLTMPGQQFRLAAHEPITVAFSSRIEQGGRDHFRS